jgi:LuxR family maltose regulon positive regulatory protein
MKDSGSRAATADEAGAGAGDWDVKFAVPLAMHIVLRPRLHARLTAGLQSCCTLIAAPAGWGKTLLAGSWLAEGGGAGRAAAWVSLGPADDDVRALWTAVATAIAPVIGEQAAADLRRVVTDDNLERVVEAPR